MNLPSFMFVCWDCIKGRHLICSEEDCKCPVTHDGTGCRRQPVYVPVEDIYIDPGEQACAAGEAPLSETCEVHDECW